MSFRLFAGAAATLGIAAVSSGGCSYLMVQGPPVGHDKMILVECNDSNALPIADAVLAGLGGLGAVAVLANSDGYPRGTIVVDLAWVGLFGSSAYYGFKRTGACSEAKDALRERKAAKPAPKTPSQVEPAGSAPVPEGLPPPPPRTRTINRTHS